LQPVGYFERSEKSLMGARPASSGIGEGQDSPALVLFHAFIDSLRREMETMYSFAGFTTV